MATFNPHTTLDSFHNAIAQLSKDATEEQLDAVIQHLAPSGGAFYLAGVDKPPVRDRETAKAGFRRMIQYWRLVERVVAVQAVTADGNTAIAEMENTLEILGERLPSFREVELAEVDPETGLIVGFRIYADNKPIQDILKKKRGGEEEE